MLQPLPALPRRNAPWTPFQRRTWLATRRRRHPAEEPAPDPVPLPEPLPFLADMATGFDGLADSENVLFNLVADGPVARLNGSAYIADWICADATVVPHCIVSNRHDGYVFSDPFPMPNAGARGTVAYKILLPAAGNYRGLCPYWGPYGGWGMSMLLIASGGVNGGADESLYIQTPKGSYFTSSVIFPKDGNFHWLIYRWDADIGFYEISVDGLAENVSQSGYEETSYDWGEVMNFSSEAQSESAECINVISHVSWWDRALTDLEIGLLMSN